jgi:hypothetical protein
MKEQVLQALTQQQTAARAVLLREYLGLLTQPDLSTDEVTRLGKLLRELGKSPDDAARDLETLEKVATLEKQLGNLDDMLVACRAAAKSALELQNAAQAALEKARTAEGQRLHQNSKYQSALRRQCDLNALKTKNAELFPAPADPPAPAKPARKKLAT